MTNLFAHNPTENLLPFDGIVNDLGQLIAQPTALYEQLLNELPWQSDKVTLFGKTHITTRQIVWMGEDATIYQYSGHQRQAIAWSEAVFHVKQLIENRLADIGVLISFNTCLLNYYPTGEDGMGYHADDEPELGYQPIIASLSLGAPRKFVLKHKTSKDKVELMLDAGQLIVMRGDTQTYWKHTITKTKTVKQGRISLTFRRMVG
ncbi:MAG: alpha-ketoglutarate-dependent dioxygenase AlkB [Psychrobacter sp.]|nr:alpha-ketoglutarate-dependent dioxygenase AlkB [Psychrobacter sp.]